MSTRFLEKSINKNQWPLNFLINLIALCLKIRLGVAQIQIQSTVEGRRGSGRHWTKGSESDDRTQSKIAKRLSNVTSEWLDFTSSRQNQKQPIYGYCFDDCNKILFAVLSVLVIQKSLGRTETRWLNIGNDFPRKYLTFFTFLRLCCVNQFIAMLAWMN